MTENDAAKAKGIGSANVGLSGIIAINAYLFLMAAVLIYGIIEFWPETVRVNEDAANGATRVKETTEFFGQTFELGSEARLFWIVAMSGALGSLVHGLKSLYWYVGNRLLVWSWLSMYVLLPFVGATLALVFYLVVRGGFFSTQATIDEMSPFGFAALAQGDVAEMRR